MATRGSACLDEWCQQIAPSTELRTWYHHEEERFEEFARCYRDELAGTERAAVVEYLRALTNYHTLTLLTATRQTNLSAAAVLADVLRDQGQPPRMST